MRYWRLTTMDLHELLRRLRAGEPERAVSRMLNLSRNTVKGYRQWAEAQGLLQGELPSLADLERLRDTTFQPQPAGPRGRPSLASDYQDEVRTLLDQYGVKPRLIWQQLRERHGASFSLSEAAIWRLTRRLRAAQLPQTVVRLETAPGEVAQVDFGFAGLLRDDQTGQMRKAWVFSLVLGWSRHQYAELVPDQAIVTWLLCHQHAFEFLGGVPRRVILDNLKAAIIRAYSSTHDVEVQRSYRECAEHYGFLIDPCLPRKPQHKGKVERGGIAYLKSSFLPLLPEGTSFNEANRRLRHWLLTTAGQRIHGTTQAMPLARFEQVEHAALLPLPAGPFDPAVWKPAKLQRDGYVSFGRSFYSAPCRLVGQTLWLRAGLREVRLFTGAHELVATHPRASAPGERLTHPEHVPAEKLRGLTASREQCLAEAQAIGPHTTRVVQELLESRPVDRLRSALYVLALAGTFTPARLEAACTRGLAFGDVSSRALKRMLEQGLDQCAWPSAEPVRSAEPLRFARSADELAAAILEGVTSSQGGTPWN